MNKNSPIMKNMRKYSPGANNNPNSSPRRTYSIPYYLLRKVLCIHQLCGTCKRFVGIQNIFYSVKLYFSFTHKTSVCLFVYWWHHQNFLLSAATFVCVQNKERRETSNKITNYSDTACCYICSDSLAFLFLTIFRRKSLIT